MAVPVLVPLPKRGLRIMRNRNASLNARWREAIQHSKQLPRGSVTVKGQRDRHDNVPRNLAICVYGEKLDHIQSWG